jgi:hypothetical protein
MPRLGQRSLVLWSFVVLALLAAHDVTHLLDDGLETGPGQLARVALPQWLVLAAVMVVIVRGYPARSRIAVLLLGIGIAFGFAGVHLLPLSSTAFWDLQPSLVSWVLVWVPAAAGLALAAIAWRRRGAAAQRPSTPLTPGRVAHEGVKPDAA